MPLPDVTDTRILIRVVKVPTTGERLDDYYRERKMLHGGNVENAIRGDGCRRTPVRGSGVGR